MQNTQRVVGADGDVYTLFYSSSSCFSNFHPCDHLKIDGVAYSCTEQYFMHQKAVTFGDKISAAKILKTTIPREMKRLGRKVTPFDAEKWKSASIDAMVKGNAHKYLQNAELRQHLTSTAGSTLAECSPRDRLWGIGLSIKNPDAANRRTWRGRNLLGKILTEIRDCLLEDPSAEADFVVQTVKQKVSK